jgi:hypothetical protein
MKYAAGIMDNDSAIDVTPMPHVDNRYGVLHTNARHEARAACCASAPCSL